MPRERRNKPSLSGYQKNVFINCPFDDGYTPLFRAAVFTVFDCGFFARSALEITNSAQVRIEKIFDLIASCRLSIHDISRTEADPVTGLPRFNMPLELGIFLGAKHFGTGRHAKKNCLVLDLEPYRYHKFISDIAGQDIEAHSGDIPTLITRIRNWLSATQSHPAQPGGSAIASRFKAFQNDMPAICATLRLQPNELTFIDYVNVVRFWLSSQAVS